MALKLSDVNEILNGWTEFAETPHYEITLKNPTVVRCQEVPCLQREGWKDRKTAVLTDAPHSCDSA
jgi:hypothetical protein